MPGANLSYKCARPADSWQSVARAPPNKRIAVANGESSSREGTKRE